MVEKGTPFYKKKGKKRGVGVIGYFRRRGGGRGRPERPIKPWRKRREVGGRGKKGGRANRVKFAGGQNKDHPSVMGSTIKRMSKGRKENRETGRGEGM